jgi:beta-N-acetylhexosaminidase
MEECVLRKILKYKPLMFILIILISFPMLLGASQTGPKNQEQNLLSNLIILQNVPEVDAEVINNTIHLQALNVYKDGHFTLVSENLRWKSSNKNVATVDDNGVVTFTGKNGRTFIYVSNGKFEDRIALDYKVNPKKKGDKKGKPPSEPIVVKQKGKKYNIIQNAVKKMTLEEKIGQMLMPDFRKWEGQNVTEMLPEIEALIKKYHLGGVILFAENVVTTEQTATLVSAYQEASEKYGLLLTIDQEGGIVTRLQSGTHMPGNMALGATGSTEIAYQVGKAIGEELEALGINMNLAPVLDVNNNPDNPVIGVRSIGEDPSLVGELGVAYIEGLQSTGVAATAKHFPGHGDTAEDSHLGLPEVPHEKDRLLEVELYPFQQAMNAGIDAIMTAHVTFPKIDDTKVISKKDGTEIALPATLSEKVLTGLMREEMNYEGVIITDAMNMAAIADHFGPVDAAVRAVKAGADIVLMPVGLEEVAFGLVEAVDLGEISMKRIDESVERILTLKIKRGIIKEETPKPVDEKIANALNIVGSEAHQQVEKEAAEKSVTLVKNEDVLPFHFSSEDKLVVIGNTFGTNLFQAISAHHANTVYINASSPLSDSQLAQLADAKAVIIGTYTFNVNGRQVSNPQMQMVNQVLEAVDVPVIGVGIRNPYDIMAYPTIDAYIAQYSFRDASFKATANVIFGQLNPTGTLPITIPSYDGSTLFEYGHGLSYE